MIAYLPRIEGLRTYISAARSFSVLFQMCLPKASKYKKNNISNLQLCAYEWNYNELEFSVNDLDINSGILMC